MIAGSATGALNAPEFIYDRKPTTLQYSRDESRGFIKGKDDRPKKDFSREPEPLKQPKMDWICDNVSFNLIIFYSTYKLLSHSVKDITFLEELNVIDVLHQRQRNQSW